MGWRDPRDDVTLWWKLGGRGKRSIALDLKSADDLELMHRLCDEADVLIENFRPGTLERLGLQPDALLGAQPEARHHPHHRVRTGRAVRQRVRDSPPSPRR